MGTLQHSGQNTETNNILSLATVPTLMKILSSDPKKNTEPSENTEPTENNLPSENSKN